MKKLRHIISAAQFDRPYVERILTLTKRFEEVNYRPTDPAMRLDGKIISTVFYQESTRTRKSFESAILRMGGHYISSVNARQFSSAKKGESLKDTIRMEHAYADAIVLRYDKRGGAATAAEVSLVPVINAGDKMGEHPTQALVDAYTLQQGIGSLDGIHVALVGDLARSRTVRSLAMLLALFNDVRITFVSPPALRLAADVRVFLSDRRVPFDETDTLDGVVEHVDAAYMTRTQNEYDADDDEPAPVVTEEQSAKCTMTYDRMQRMKRHSIVTHPLPHRNEIEEACDTDVRRAAYLKAGFIGVCTREGVLLDILKEDQP